VGGGSTAASTGGGDEEEQKSASFREDLAAADGDGGEARNETEAPVRALKEVSAEGEDGSRRAEEANAILTAASIPEARVGAIGARRPPFSAAEGRAAKDFLSDEGIFYIFFYLYFAKIYGRSETLQNYTSAAGAHGVRDITPWPTAVGAASSGPVAWDEHNGVTHDVRNIASYATTLCPSAVGHGGSRPAGAVPRRWHLTAYITPKFSRKCHNNSKKKKERGKRRRE
jgi:hypothetical protein